MPAPLRQRKSAGVDYEKYQAALQQRTQEAYDRKDFSGRYGSYIKEEYRNLLWKDSSDVHVIDIVPYLAGPDHPTLSEGDPAFLLDFFIHRGVGPNEESIVCLARTFKGGQCPVCEMQREMRREGSYSDEEVNALGTSRRNLYNIVCRDNDKEEAKGLQIFDIAQFYFDKHLSARCRTRSGELINYAMPTKAGKSIQFEKKGAKNTMPEYLAHTFLDRDYDIEPEYLQNAYPLDQVIIIPSYEEVQALLEGGVPIPRQAQGGTKTASQPTTTRTRHIATPSPSPAPVASRPPVVSQSQEVGCPAGGNFGVDIDSLPACSSCEVWDDCAEEERKLRSGGEQGEVQAPPPVTTKVSTPPTTIRRRR